MFNESLSFEKLHEAQKQQLEPVMKWNSFALAAAEKFARKNHEVAGDWLEFMVSQGQTATDQSKTGPEIVSACVEGGRAFGEKMVQRSTEYVELTKSLSADAQTQVFKA